MRSLLFATALLLAGCLSADEPDGTAPVLPAGTPGSTLLRFVADYNLSTRGDVHATGTYLHPNGPLSAGDYTCVFIRVLDADVRHLDATAEWAGTERLVLFDWFKESGAPSRNHNHSIGGAPLRHHLDVSSLGSEWIAVGVQPASDLPVGIGAEDDVRLHVELTYAGRAPSFSSYNGCTYQMGPAAAGESRP